MFRMQSLTGRKAFALHQLARFQRLKPFAAKRGIVDNVSGLTISEAFERSVEQNREKDACVFHDGTRRTFQQFHSDVAKFSSGLQHLRLEPLSRIAIFAPTCYDWLIAKYAINRAGCVVVAMNSGAHEEELRHVLKKTECKAIILGRPLKQMDYYATLRAALPNLGNASSPAAELKHIIEMGSKKTAGTISMDEMLDTSISHEVPVSSKDPAVIIQSSGSTGKPKSIVLTHANIVSAANFDFPMMRLRKSNIVLASLPLYHSFGYICIEACDTLNGLTTVYTSTKAKPAEILRVIAEEKVSTIHGTPTTFYDLLQCAEFPQSNVSSLENGTIGATTLHQATVEEIRNTLGLQTLMKGYGLTETSGACAFGDGNNFDGYELMPQTEARVLKADGSGEHTDEKGEIQLRGPTLFKEYAGEAQITAGALTADGWLRTGDIGLLSEKRKLIVTGRLTDMIIKGGVNVYPVEVELVLLQHPSIVEAHVVGVSDDRLGEEICAWIKVHQGHEITEKEVKDFADQKLSHIKVPKYVIVTKDFPRTSVGKISKIKLREAFETMKATS